jgi:16S rRNA (adenine1518-N6/adenine1519-N6)-dimethyltransferase
VVRALLSEHAIRPDKAFGQNFLIDGNILGRIVEAAAVGPGDSVLEVGPGLGALTRELAGRAREVVAVELDRKLLPVLEKTLAGLDNVRLVNADALRFDLGEMPHGSLMVANLPYNVGTAVMVRALESMRFKRLVVLVQKEVAQRLVAPPGGESYGYLSLVVGHFAVAEIVRDVPSTAFLPAPEVTSSVVRITCDLTASPDPGLFALVEASFKHRRKTLKKNLVMAGYAAAAIEAALGALGIAPKARAETLSLAEFRELRSQLDKPAQAFRV